MRAALLSLALLFFPAATEAQSLPNRFRGIWARDQLDGALCQRSGWHGIGQSKDNYIEITPDRISYYQIVCDLKKYTPSYKGKNIKIDERSTVDAEFICEEEGKKTPEKILMTTHKFGRDTLLTISSPKWVHQTLYLKCE